MPEKDRPPTNNRLPAPPGSLRPFQFSLTTVFVVMTVLAFVFSLYFGVGRMVGMSTEEVARQGLVRLVYTVPAYLVWTVGLTMAFRRRKQYRTPALLTLFALSGLILSSFVSNLVQMALIHLVNAGQINQGFLQYGFTTIGIVNIIINTTMWILILVAIFSQRPVDSKLK